MEEMKEFLCQIPIFHGLRKENLQTISHKIRILTFNAGEKIFNDQSYPDSVYIIASGQVGLYSNKKKVAELSKGAIIGVLNILNGWPLESEALAEETVKLYWIAQEDFLNLFNSFPFLYRNLVFTLSQRLHVDDATSKVIKMEEDR